MKSYKLLESFVMYCTEHPEQRFWQALRNWSGDTYIFRGDKLASEVQGGRDTFYFEEKDK
jgi:hypothetical protein